MELFANVFAIVSGITAVFGVWLTARQLNETAEMQQDQQAVSLFSEYAKQAYEMNKDADAYPVFVVHTAESIFRLRSDSGWRATVRGLLIDNEAALLSVGAWHCDAWDGEFFEYAAKTLPKLCCASVPPGRSPRPCRDK